MQQPFKILWCSLSSLVDNSNGAAISNKYILERLAQCGAQVTVLCTTIADAPQGMEGFDKIKDQVPLKDGNYYQLTLNGVEYFMMRTEHWGLREIKMREQNSFWSLWVNLLDSVDPDLVLGYAPDLFSCSVRREAKARGVSVGYSLCNAAHLGYVFPDCDVVFTNSRALCDFYAQKSEGEVVIRPFGIMIDKERNICPPESRNPRYITYVNPVPNKGLSIFVKLANAFKEKYPDSPYRFLAVKNRSNYDEAMKSLINPDGTPYLTNENIKDKLSNFDVAEPTFDMKAVYGLTKVLLAPSLVFEAWGMVATEANFNGIPVIGHDHGGIPEAMGRQIIIAEDGSRTVDDSHLGGILIEPPRRLLLQQNSVPTDEEIAPYLAALEQILANEELYQQKALQAAAVNDTEIGLQRLIALIKPLLEKGRINKRNHTQSFFLPQSSLRDIYHRNHKLGPYALSIEEQVAANIAAKAKKEAEAKGQQEPSQGTAEQAEVQLPQDAPNIQNAAVKKDGTAASSDNKNDAKAQQAAKSNKAGAKSNAKSSAKAKSATKNTKASPKSGAAKAKSTKK